MDVNASVLPDWLNVSRETASLLADFVALVEKWNPAINLVSKSSIARIWERHLYDSAQIFLHAPKDARHWVDLGSGAGFPGLVVAILAREATPDLRVTLVEADQRKSTFLSQAVRQLGLKVAVLTQRIEAIPPQGADILSARALAPLTDLCHHAHRHLAPNGVALFPKGQQAEDEILHARRVWAFDLIRYPSKTDAGASILAVKNVAHV